MTVRRRAMLVVLLLCSLGTHVAWAEARFVETGRIPGARAAWLALEGDRLVYGGSGPIDVALAAPAPERRARIERTGPVLEGVAAGDLLYVATAGGRIERYRLDRPGEGGWPVTLDPAPRGDVLLGRVGDYLIVVEQDRALWLHEIVAHAHHGAEHREVGDLRAAGELPLRGRARAVTSSGLTAYVAFEGGRVAVIDVSDPLRPTLTREIGLDAGAEIQALAASDKRLFVLDGSSLRLLDIAGSAPRLLHEMPLAGARAIEVAGRAIYVATEDGILALRDASAGATIFPVTVGTSFFSPQQVTVAPNDTVTWNKALSGVPHNVEACDGLSDPGGCGGTVAPEPFRSGNATTAAFQFSVDFTLPGEYPYFCVIHEATGMRGVVIVQDTAPTGPPGVPDRPPGTMMRVSKNDAAGTSLTLTYDTGTCTGALDHHIVVGGGTTFPPAIGGVLNLKGSTCNIGTTSPFVWNPSPATTIDAEGLVWWLIVADDNALTEGAWGQNSAGNERIGPAPDGSSAQCGITTKDLANTCGQ
jgi:plastocyanin